MASISLEEARKMLGKVAEKMTDDELERQLTNMEYIAEYLLDTYEKKIFKGKTLAELVPEIGIRKSLEQDDPIKTALRRKI